MANAITDNTTWAEPKPLRDSAQLPSFPTDTLPAWLRAMVEAVSEETQTPVDLAGMLALGALSIAIGKKTKLRIRGDWTEQLTFSCVVAMDPASRKSAVFQQVMRPLKDYETTLLNDPVSPKRIFVSDTTPEALAGILARNDGFAALADPEGGPFGMMAGRYGRPNIDVYLKGFTGETVTIDRTGKSETIQRPFLPVIMTVQPSVIHELSRTPALRDRGLLARLCWALPKDMVGKRKIVTDPVPSDVGSAYAERLLALAQLPLPAEPKDLALTQDATDALLTFAAWVEPQMAMNGSLFRIRDWAGKVSGLVSRLAALLHLGASPAGTQAPVTVDHINSAVRLAQEFLIPHALAAFDALGEDQGLTDAETLLNWIITFGQPVFTRREALRGNRTLFKQEKRLTAALDRLTAHCHVRPVTPTDGPKVGRPSVKFSVNPAHLDDTGDRSMRTQAAFRVRREPTLVVGNLIEAEAQLDVMLGGVANA